MSQAQELKQESYNILHVNGGRFVLPAFCFNLRVGDNALHMLVGNKSTVRAKWLQLFLLGAY